MATQKPLISLSQDTKSQGRHGRKPMEEIMNRSRNPTLIRKVISLSQETISQEIPKKPKQGKFGMELIEEMSKPPIPIYHLSPPTYQQPPLHKNHYFYNYDREFVSWGRSVDESDMESEWHSRRCFMGTDEGRTSPPGFSNV